MKRIFRQAASGQDQNYCENFIRCEIYKFGMGEAAFAVRCPLKTKFDLSTLKQFGRIDFKKLSHSSKRD